MANGKIAVPCVVSLGIELTASVVVGRLRVDPAESVARGFALAAPRECELAFHEMIDAHAEDLRGAVGKHHRPQVPVEDRADGAFLSGQVVGNGKEPDGSGQAIELGDLLVGRDVHIAGVHLDAGNVAALERTLLREQQQRIIGCVQGIQPVVGPDPHRGPVNGEDPNLLGLHQGQGEVVEHARQDAKTRQADVGATPQVVGHLIQLSHVPAGKPVGRAEAAQAVHVGAVVGDAFARGEPHLAAHGQGIVHHLRWQPVLFRIHPDSAVQLAVTRDPLVGRKPHELIVECHRGHHLAGQAVVHGDAGGA